jgi:hypothetical protein
MNVLDNKLKTTYVIIRLKKFTCAGEKKHGEKHIRIAKKYIKSYARKHNLVRANEEPITPSPHSPDKKRLALKEFIDV